MQPQEYLDRLSTHLKNTIARAIGTATAMAHTEVTPLHLLFAMYEEPGAIATEILNKIKLNKQEIEAALGAIPTVRQVQPGATITTTLPELNQPSKQALEKAMLLAYEYEHSFIGTEHLLYGMLHIEDAHLQKLLAVLDVPHAQIVKEIQTILEGTNKFPDIEDIAETLEEMHAMIEEDLPAQLPEKKQSASKKKHKQKKGNSAVDIFTVELTDKERQKKIDPVIGREQEIERMVHVLSRRTKNNPVLVGEPGVGKTAIVEGLAKRIVEKDVPDVLKNKRIYSLDLTLLISGTIYRGEFESRIKQVMDEFADNDQAILFIDEIHNIIGAGSNQGTMDAANILKPALARGELHCIGATTLDEYQKYISTDPALARRFQSITVGEPSEDQAIDILTGVKKYYEAFHHVAITEEAITTAVALSTKYIHDNFLPDKAIDLLDEAAAAVKVARIASEAERQQQELRDTLGTLEIEKEEAIADEQFETALAIKEKIIHVETALKDVEKTIRAEQKKEKKKPVTKTHVAAVLAARIGQTAERLLEDEWTKTATLEDTLKTHILGQDHVLKDIANTLRKGYLNLTQSKRPIASFLFTGPSGTGKTALAKALAHELYADEQALVRLDMTEFAESHGVSKLLGSPAGYVGYNERNKFLENIRLRPYSIVLFDEFDKAHPDVQKLLIQILDDGMLTDSTGRKISFEHTVVILTANIGAEKFRSLGIGFGTDEANHESSKQAVLADLKESLSATLLGRIDTTCIFTPLDEKTVQAIIKKHVTALATALKKERDMSFKLDDKAIHQLAKDTFKKETGVREMERAIDTIVQNLVIQKLRQKRRKKSYTLTTAKSTYKLV